VVKRWATCQSGMGQAQKVVGQFLQAWPTPNISVKMLRARGDSFRAGAVKTSLAQTPNSKESLR
jgi:hypothetical protein